MRRRLLRGRIVAGAGAAAESLGDMIAHIRARTGLRRLHAATLNVRLPHWYTSHPDFVLWAREYGHHEHLFLERCQLFNRPALILRTSENHHGSFVLEILATERVRRNHRLRIGDRISLTVFTHSNPRKS